MTAASPSPALFRGAGVALLTLFDQRGGLLVEETAAFAADLVRRGARGVLVAGTTGEFWTLSPDERLDLAAAVRDAVPQTVPVLLGIGALDEQRALELATAAAGTGVDAALCFCPSGASPSAFYARVREAVADLPLLAYHFPAVGYTPLEVDDLAHLPIDGIKDSSGEPQRLLSTSGVLPRGVYTGSPLLCSLAAALPIDGALLALANAAPAAAQAAVDGDPRGQHALVDLHTRITGGTPPSALKEYVAGKAGTPPWTRGVPLSAAR